MNVLAIECTHQVASVAVTDGERVFQRNNSEWQRSAELLVPLVMEVMDEAGLKPQELRGVAVSSGPGSFTALRIGMSVAKGIAYGAGCPLVAVPTLFCMAEHACGGTDAASIVPVIPSRLGEFFFAIYSRIPGRAGLEEVASGRCFARELVAKISSIGNAVSVPARDVQGLLSHAPELAPVCVDASSFGASDLLGRAREALAAGTSTSPADVGPDYRQIFVPLQKKQ